MSQEHCPYGRGLLRILPDLKSRSLGIPGVGLVLRTLENTASPKRPTPLPSRPDNTLGRREPGPSQEGEGSHATQRDSPGQVGGQGLEIPGSLLPGSVCRIQGSHVAGGCDQVDDTDERLERRDRGGDPEAHSEKTHRAN